ncbi:putative serine/threonine-protein kinase HT1-like [Capsicum annuum]|nr:putative serine/threonine-protein kinase HT1-like [Capsicum annuum]
MFMLQKSGYVFQVPGTSVLPQLTYSPSFLSFSPPPIHTPFHPNQSSCILRTQKNCQRAKPRNLLASFDDYNDVEMEEGDGVARAREDEKNYDKDPELAEILGNCLDDPDKAKSREVGLSPSAKPKLVRHVCRCILSSTGSLIRTGRSRVQALETASSRNARFDFTNNYVWFEFYNAPLEKDISLICDLSQSLLDKRPCYDAVQGANVTPTTFYNIGDLEIQDNFARIWVDIGTSEPLLLDVLINALSQISSDHVGIKQVVFGGSEFENWKENLTSEDAGYSVHKI